MSVPAHWIDSGTPDFFLRCQFKHIRLVQARQTAQGMPDCLLAHQFKHIRLAQTCQTGPRHARLTPGTSIQAHQAGPSTPDSPNACHIASWHASSSISGWPKHARLGPGMPDCLLARQFRHVRLAQARQTGPRQQGARAHQTEHLACQIAAALQFATAPKHPTEI